MLLETEFKMLFISLDWYRTKDPKTPLAIASIETQYRKNAPQNVEAVFKSFDLQGDFSIYQVHELIDQQKPNFLAIGVYIWNELWVQDLLAYTKKYYPDTQIILGGPQITFGGYELKNSYPGVDWFIKGAGETTLARLVKTLSGEKPLEDLLNDWKSGIYHSTMVGNSKASFINQDRLHELESPFLSGIVNVPENSPFQRWETLRGCPYQCTFCQFKIDKMKPELFTHKRLFKELALLKDQRVREVAVLDPIFNFNPKHYLPILQEIQRLEMETTFSFQARLELLTKPHGKDFLSWAQQYRNVKLEFGVQTFNETESFSVKRNNRFPEIQEGIKLLQQYEIDFELHLILGLPHQTTESFWDSYDQAISAGPNRLYIFPLNILKGTGIEDEAYKGSYQWDTDNYNIITESRWMDAQSLTELKEFANQINKRSKQTPIHQKTSFPQRPSKLSA